MIAYTWNDWRRIFRLIRRHLRHGRSSFGPQPSAQRTEALTALYREVNDWLQGLDVEYSLVFGTLLGWHRERRILPHDLDVDFGAPVRFYEKIRRAADGLPPGFTLHDTTHRHHGPKLYVSYRGWEADIYFFAEEGDHMRSLERCRNPGEVSPFPRAYFFPLQTTEFLGRTTRVMAQPELWLRHTYQYIGPNAVRNPVSRYFEPAAKQNRRTL